MMEVRVGSIEPYDGSLLALGWETQWCIKP